MSKRWGATPKQVSSWIARGDGQGEGLDYKPFLRVRDVPSKGRSAIVLGLKTGRIHHYLSNLEYYTHLLAEYDPSITDIREQYALLPWEETHEIALNLGIKPLFYPWTNTPVVMTSDIVLTNQENEYEVICIKPASAIDIGNPKAKRTLEKLLIEKTYWTQRDVRWRLFTDKNIPEIRARNLDMLRISLVAKELDWLSKYIEHFVDSFEKNWTRERPLLVILEKVSRKIGIDQHHCFFLFGRAVWLRLINIDLDSEIINHHYPVKRKVSLNEVSNV